MRTLASIQRIESLSPIPNSDNLEKATILGWSCVVKKGDFTPGSLCVYCEVDSILPERPEFEFLRQRHFRIKTVRLRGQISQGICFPLSILPSHITPIEGFDVTDTLNITKYEPQIPIELKSEVRGNFPPLIPKTDETRIQSVPDVLKRNQYETCYITEKLDGTSCTFIIIDGELHVCSRNLDLKDSPNNIYWNMARKYNIENVLLDSSLLGAIQGEICGPGINENPLGLTEHTFFAFNTFTKDYRYLNKLGFNLLSSVGIPSVPVICPNISLPGTVSEMVKIATQKSSLNPNMWMEGIVCRSHNENKTDEELGRLSFKVINPEYLIQNE